MLQSSFFYTYTISHLQLSLHLYAYLGHQYLFPWGPYTSSHPYCPSVGTVLLTVLLTVKAVIHISMQLIPIRHSSVLIPPTA